MATITVDVQDRKLKFFKELIDQLPFVKIREDETSRLEDPVRPVRRSDSGTPADAVDSPGRSAGAVGSPDEDTDEQVIANIREGVRQMRLVEQGKMKSRPAREFLNEL